MGKKIIKRKIIQIDEEKCNGCGQCTTVCAEAALEIINGKAKVSSDFLCDGLGACLDVCPVGALKIVEKEVADYDSKLAYTHVKNIRGEAAAQKVHGFEKNVDKNSAPEMKCGCPGSMMRDFTGETKNGDELNDIELSSQLRQWPIQLHLLSPHAPYLQDADLIISADCAPFAYANFHRRFLKGKILVILCPKLDEGQEGYVEKLREIFEQRSIKSITIVHMEVPCCYGIEQLVRQALEQSGKNIVIHDYTVSLKGEII